jgi:UDP-3-O-[3-hydroxymyristoyl] N-acetylglucosamine deacetylase
MVYQRTIKEEIGFTGIGLHTGKKVRLELRPASPNAGITFVREDLRGVKIKARPENFSTSIYATSISNNGAAVQTVEHFMAALYCFGIDNLEVSIDGPELPIMDGSAAPFIYMIHEAGVKTQTRLRKALRIVKPVKVADPGKGIAIYPSDSFRITYTIAFEHPLLRRQSRSFLVNEETFVEEIAPARTFGFLSDVEKMRRNGLALGGSLENAIVIGENRILNKNLRYSDEFVRHKILDAIGDLSFLGMRIKGHVVAQRAGHTLHIALINALLSDKEAYVVEKARAEEHEKAQAPALGLAGSEQYT